MLIPYQLYQHLLSTQPKQVEEKRNFYFPLTERHLQVLWMEQKFLASLTTEQGELVTVLSPGIWNTEAGPDFLKAHLRIGSQDYRGDIEIHWRDEGWYQHNHQQDPRYNQVILHLSYWRPTQWHPIRKENGQHAFSCYLEGNLTIPLQQLVSLVDFDLYPSKRFVGSGRCAEHLFRTLPEQQTRALLQSAAYWRLERKNAYLQQHFTDRTWQFVAGIAMALGYKHNATAFLDLFLYLLAYRDVPYDELLAIAFGCCGFLEQGRQQKWESSSYYQYLRSLWCGKSSQITHQTHLNLNHIRPLHHPVRRLAYLMHLLQDPCLERLWPAVLSLWKSSIKQQRQTFRQLKEQLLELLPLYQDPYWDYHFTFETTAQSKPLPSLGHDLKTNLLLNTYLPLIYATLKQAGDPNEWEHFQQFYLSLASAQTSKSHYLHQRFFGDEKRESLLSEAQMAQGAYQLHHDFCTHFEANCEGCPFVERYQTRLRQSWDGFSLE